MKSKAIKFCLALVITLSGISLAKAQIQPTGAGTTGGAGGLNLFNLFGGGQNANNSTTGGNTQMVAPQVIQSTAPSGADTSKLAKEVEYSEVELRRRQIQKEMLELEDEIAELSSRGMDTPQDSINLTIKKENLRLLYLKEQVVLKEELKQMGGLRDYGSSPVYGHHFFRSGGIKFFQKASDATPSSAYVLGPEDKLQVEVWGYANLSFDVIVESNGYANLPKGQKVYLRGVTLGNARKLLRKRLSNMVNLSNSFIEISIVKYRTITVHIVGEVFKPGSYVIPAINTAFNALTVMGGPTNIGSVRNIYVKRGGEIVDSLDAYDYMLNPKKSREIYLQDNDYIIVDPIGKIVSLSGAIKRQGNYELKPKEKLSDLLRIAAGINPTTYLSDVLVSRIIDNKYYKQLAINYDSLVKTGQDFELLMGDEIEFKTIADDDNQLVMISGSVNIPGVYKVSKTSTIKELIENANGLLLEAYTKEAYLIRTNKDFSKKFISFNLAKAIKDGGIENITIQPFDEIYIFSLKNYQNVGRLKISGALRKPKSIPFAHNVTIRDMVFMAGGLIPESYMDRAVLIRTNPTTKEKQNIMFSVTEIINNSSSEQNLMLQRDDAIEIFSKVTFRDKYKVKIEGAIHKGGEYDYTENLNLRDLILMAGGLSTEANNAKIEIVRMVKNGTDPENIEPIPAEVIVFDIVSALNPNKEFEKFLIFPFDQIRVRSHPEYLNQKTVTLTGAVMYPGTYTLISEDEKLDNLIKRAGGLRSYAFDIGVEFKRVGEDGTTYLVTDLKKALKHPNSSYNYSLRDGDEINIPVATKLVAITGHVGDYGKKDLSVFYKRHRRARHYVKRYRGGFQPKTKKRKTFVVYADGSVKRTKNFVLFKVYPKPKPGSEIVLVKNTRVRKRLNAGETIDQITLRLTALLSIFAIFKFSTQ